MLLFAFEKKFIFFRVLHSKIFHAHLNTLLSSKYSIKEDDRIQSKK